MAYDYFPDGQHVGVVYCIEFRKCELYIWSMATGQPETIVKGLPGGILDLDFTPNGKAFLTLSEDGLVSAWSVENQALLAESLPFDRAEPVISPDGRLTAIPRGNQIEIYDVVSGELWQEMGDYLSTRSLMVNSITEEYLLVSGVDSSDKPFAELWDLTRKELVRKFNPLDYPYFYSNETFCVHDQQERYIACGSNPLQIFDIKTGELIYSNKSQEGTLIWAISPDGNTLATCTMLYEPDSYEPILGDRIFLLDIPNSTSLIAGVLEAPGGGICSPMVFSTDSQYLAVQSGYIWKLGQQQPQASFDGNYATPLAFNPDGSLLISGNQVIETTSGKTQAVLEVDGEVEKVGFDPGGYRVVIKTDQGVEVWNISGD